MTLEKLIRSHLKEKRTAPFSNNITINLKIRIDQNGVTTDIADTVALVRSNFQIRLRQQILIQEFQEISIVHAMMFQ